jgi:hypothetical protein
MFDTKVATEEQVMMHNLSWVACKRNRRNSLKLLEI